MKLSTKHPFLPLKLLLYIYSAVPDAPSSPEVFGVTDDSVTLSWMSPRSDGGSPITGYLVEMKESLGTRWIRATRRHIHDTNITIPNLSTGKQYKFRVIAENDIGQSEAGPASSPVLVKAPEGNCL